MVIQRHVPGHIPMMGAQVIEQAIACSLGEVAQIRNSRACSIARIDRVRSIASIGKDVRTMTRYRKIRTSRAWSIAGWWWRWVATVRRWLAGWLWRWDEVARASKGNDVELVGAPNFIWVR